LPEPIIAYLIEFSWISLEIELTQLLRLSNIEYSRRLGRLLNGCFSCSEHGMNPDRDSVPFGPRESLILRFLKPDSGRFALKADAEAMSGRQHERPLHRNQNLPGPLRIASRTASNAMSRLL
jgi:hypothetical protein